MKTRACVIVAFGVVATTLTLRAQFSISPLVGFGGSDGWLAPNENGYSWLTTGDTERGLAFGNNHLYLVSRATNGPSIRILNDLTGADLGALNLGNGVISGGTFPVNMAAVGTDGAIYVANLANPLNTTTPFKVYRWANESATPTLALSSTNLSLGRLGDTLAIFGGGTSTRIAAGESDNSGSGARNGYAILSSGDGLNFSGKLVTFSGEVPAAGDFRLGLTFKDANTVIGTQGGGSSTTLRVTTFSGTNGTLLGSPSLTLSGAQRPMAFTTIGGLSLLATESTTDATVRIWDMTNPNSPVLLGSRNNTSGTLATNTRNTGELAWGDISGNTARLFALSSNQGIQAFTVTIPEPGVLALAGLGLALAICPRWLRKS